MVTGFTLAFARALGEYGSVVFISGNMPMRTEITPLLIITKLEQYDYAGATAIAVVMLVSSFVLLLAINLLQRWAGDRERTVIEPDARLTPSVDERPGPAGEPHTGRFAPTFTFARHERLPQANSGAVS